MKKWQALMATALCTSVIVVPAVQTEASSTHYTVQKGDTLAKIASKYKVTIAQLKSWNALTTNTIYVKQKLVVKKSTSTQAQSSNQVQESSSTTAKTYKIKKGDTLTKIAKKHSTTVANIKKWNKLTTDTIRVNQILIVAKNGNAPIVSEQNNNSIGNSGNNSTVVPAPAPESSKEQQLSAIDKMIEKQLASEKIITKAPSAAGQKKYDQIIAEAKKHIGVPYVFGGITPAGFDCSGFIYYLYNKAGVEIPRRSALDYFLKDTVTVKNPVPGDIVFFKNTYIATVSHVAIYLGNDEILHANTGGVAITKLSYKYWNDRTVAIKRFKQLP